MRDKEFEKLMNKERERKNYGYQLKFFVKTEHGKLLLEIAEHTSIPFDSNGIIPFYRRKNSESFATYNDMKLYCNEENTYRTIEGTVDQMIEFLSNLEKAR